MGYLFTADQHMGHRNVLKYCNRPFDSIEENDEIIIENHNKKVKENDIVVHGGDYTLANRPRALDYVIKLNGTNIFLRGSHDYWLDKNAPYMFERKIGGEFIVVCHYAMRVWHRSHWNSWQLYGHSHGNLAPEGKQWDIGVDNNNFYPVSFDEIVDIMKSRPDNFNLVKNRR